DVKEFSDNRITLKTELGGLLILGKKLNMSHLDTDTGELSVSGERDMIKYTSSQSGA
ncbi:MAG: YabP/YqfC family sporulation protein, partial [Clostridia bacterium]|nr:YabP/YqfC family sporulation protein [Clostridia bacterium]